MLQNINESAQKSVGEMVRQLIFSPGESGNPRLRVAINYADRGASAVKHTHPGGKDRHHPGRRRHSSYIDSMNLAFRVSSISIN